MFSIVWIGTWKSTFMVEMQEKERERKYREYFFRIWFSKISSIRCREHSNILFRDYRASSNSNNAKILNQNVSDTFFLQTLTIYQFQQSLSHKNSDSKFRESPSNDDPNVGYMKFSGSCKFTPWYTLSPFWHWNFWVLASISSIRNNFINKFIENKFSTDHQQNYIYYCIFSFVFFTHP